MSLLKTGMGKVLLVFLVIILIPLSVYTVYQAISFTSAGEEADQLYRLQLETVLFSVNQNSEDVTANLTARITSSFLSFGSSNDLRLRLQQIINETGFLSSITFVDSLQREIITVPALGEKSSVVSENLSLAGTASARRLYEYIKSGYRKIEPVTVAGDTMKFLFIADRQDGSHLLCILTFPLHKYISSVLGPKIRTVAGDQYFLSIYKKTGKRIYSHGSDRFEADAVKPLWLISHYEIGIKARGTTLRDAIKERTAMNLRLLIVLNVSLLFGAALIGYIVRREMKLTRLKSDFVANVSHELRTPLSLISMFSESLMLGRVKNEEKQREYYRIIHGETERLSGLVNKILSFSKMEAGKRVYNFAEISITDLIKRVYNSYEYHLEQKGFASELRLPQEELIISGDEHALEEVIINLLDNAIKYSAEKKFVAVSVSAESGFVKISVADRGIGIPKEDQKRVFEKFFRAESSEVHSTKGTGLGLSIVKQIAEAHKGKITFSSETGKGSVFTLVIPRVVD